MIRGVIDVAESFNEKLVSISRTSAALIKTVAFTTDDIGVTEITIFVSRLNKHSAKQSKSQEP